MNLYIRMMNKVVEYIEENIYEPLTLQEISQQFYLSEFHFSRLFKIMTGRNLKQYIQGRKLTLALENLKNPNNRVITVAYDYGFEYPEVFSRAFKKQFGISPSTYQKSICKVNEIPKASVIERNIANMQGSFAIKGSYLYLENFDLHGIYVEVNENSSDFAYKLNNVGEEFFNAYLDDINDENLYSVVNCHGDDSGDYTVFFGGMISPESEKCKLKVRQIPTGWYVSFQYHGNMFDMRDSFVDDLYQWIMIKEVELNSNGIGMINIYEKTDVHNIRILIPIKMPNDSKKGHV